jgi:hypothetical protein
MKIVCLKEPLTRKVFCLLRFISPLKENQFSDHRAVWGSPADTREDVSTYCTVRTGKWIHIRCNTLRHSGHNLLLAPKDSILFFHIISRHRKRSKRRRRQENPAMGPKNMRFSSKGTRPSIISIDLGLHESVSALHHLLGSKRRHEVSGAIVHAKSCGWHEALKVDRGGLQGIFHSLARLPCLQQLTVDFAGLSLSAANLVALLNGGKNLKMLHLRHVAPEGSDVQYEEIGRAMESHCHLAKVSITNCSSTPRFLRLLSRIPNIKEVELVGTQVAYSTAGASTTLLNLCQVPSLASLSLQDNPGIRGQDFIPMCHYLSQPDYAGSLRELNVKSNTLTGANFGVSITKMLLTDRTIQKVAMQHCLYESSCGEILAAVLASNSSLVSLDLRLLGGRATEVLRGATMMVQALQSPFSRLKRLCLHLDVDSM